MTTPKLHRPIARVAGAIVVGLSIANHGASAQTITNSVAGEPVAIPSDRVEPQGNTWAFSTSASTYIIPDGREYVQPTFAADRNWLHLEARYNYESLETGSAWFGYNFSIGQKLVLEATPMLGGVFGNTTGVAPGYRFSLAYHRFELASEGEYVIDAGDCAGNFFYTWSELAYSPVDWLRFGLAAQRTKAYQTDLDIQRGFLVGFSYWKMDFTTYVFNLGWTDPTIVLTVGINF